MADDQAETESAAPLGSSYLFNADAQAVLEEAPTLDVGLQLLNEYYTGHTWDKPEEAASTAAKYAQDLRYRFEDSNSYDLKETGKLAPISFGEITSDAPDDLSKNLDRIQQWKDKNTEYLKTSTDPMDVLNREKLLRSIDETALKLTREARFDDRGKLTGILEDMGARVADTTVGNISKLVGLGGVSRTLQEHTNPSYDDDFGTDVVNGLGTVGGTFAATLAAGPVGTWSYLTATGVGAVKERYEQAKRDTGDISKARTAAAIETGAQIVQTAGFAKVFGRAGNLVRSRIMGRELAKQATMSAGKRILQSAAIGSATLGVGGGISNEAESIATNNPNVGFTDDLDKRLLLGAVFGTFGGAIEGGLDPTVRPDPVVKNGGEAPPVDVDIVGNEKVEGEPSKVAGDFITQDGSVYSKTPEGSTVRLKASSNEQFQPSDKTFYVNTEVATKLAALRGTQDPDGSTVHVTTDGENLYVQSKFIGDDLLPLETPSGRDTVQVPVEMDAAPGLHPVEVNKPRTAKAGQVEYRSHIGRPIETMIPNAEVTTGTSAGAMGINETKERRAAERIRLNPNLEQAVREGLGDEELGLSRYFVEPNVKTIDAAGKVIAEKGVVLATKEILDLPEDFDSPVLMDTGRQLVEKYNSAAKEARLAGDTIKYEQLSHVAGLVADKMARLLTNKGQFTQAAAIWAKLDPGMRVASLRRNIQNEAVREFAAEKGMSPEEVAKLPKAVEEIDQQIAAEQEIGAKRADAVSKTFDPEIKETEALIEESSRVGEEKLAEFTKQEEGRAQEAETQAKNLEEEYKKKAEEENAVIQKEQASAEARVKEIEDKAAKRVKEESAAVEKEAAAVTKLETKGLEQAQKKLESEIDAAEKTVAKAKAAGKKTDKVEEGIEKLKAKRKSVTPEDGLSPEEKSILRKLRTQTARAKKPTPESVLSAAEKKELANLQNILSRSKSKVAAGSQIPEKVKLKIDNLKKLAKDIKDKASKATPEDFVGAADKAKIIKLKTARDNLIKAKNAEKSKRSSYLTPEQREKIKTLTAKREKIAKDLDDFSKKSKKKQEALSPADEETFKKLVGVLPKLGNTAERAKVEAKLRELETKIKGQVDPSDLWKAYWYSNILSNPATHITNIVSNAMQATTIPAAYAVSGKPGLAVEFIRGVAGALGEGVRSAVHTFKTGEAKLRGEDSKYGNKSDLVKEGPKGIRNVGYILRALSAEDEFFYHIVKEGQARALARHYAEKKGLSGRALQEQIAKDLYQSPQSWKESRLEAEQQAAILKEADIKISEQQLNNMTWEIMENKRSDLLRGESSRFAQENTFTNMPKGAIGHIVRGIEQVANTPVPFRGKIYKPLSYVLPFMKIGGNLANAFLDYTPVGLARGVSSKQYVAGENALKLGKFEAKDSLTQRTELGRFMLGALSTGIVLGFAQQDLNEKDPTVAVYGPGPKNSQAKALLRQTGWVPYSIKIGNTYIPYKNTPLVFALGAIGALHDNARFNKSYDTKSASAKLDLAIMGMAGAFTENSFLKSISEVVGALSGDETKSPTNILTDIPKGFIPLSGALRFASNITDAPIQTKNDIWAKFISGIPIAQSIGTKPALNAFGDQVEKTFAERMSLNRFYGARVTDPDWTWIAESGYALPDPGGIDMSLGEKFNKAQIKNYGPEFAGIMTPEQRYELTLKSGPDVRKIVQKYRSKYGNSGYQEKVQEALKDEVSKVRSQWKKKLFLH